MSTSTSTNEMTQEYIETLSDTELKKLYYEETNKENSANIQQLTMKTQINGIYGALANKHFSLYNTEIAKAITGNGRYYIKLLGNMAQDVLGSMVDYKGASVTPAGDTDSCYINLEPFVNKYLEKNPNKTDQEITDFLDKFSKKVINKILDDSIDLYSSNFNSYDKSVIGVEREVIANRANFHAKKNYIMSVIDDEGTRYHEKPKIKMTGVEVKKSSIPPFVKDKFESVIDVLLFKENSDIIDFIKESKEEMFSQKIYRLSKTTSVSSLDYALEDKGVPINSRAALVYNKYIKDENITDIYESIQPGDKIKIVYLNPANPTLSNVIAYKDPRFIEIFKDYIDYNTIWEKFFENSLENMTNPIDWNLKIGDTLEYDEW